MKKRIWKEGNVKTPIDKLTNQKLGEAYKKQKSVFNQKAEELEFTQDLVENISLQFVKGKATKDDVKTAKNKLKEVHKSWNLHSNILSWLEEERNNRVAKFEKIS